MNFSKPQYFSKQSGVEVKGGDARDDGREEVHLVSRQGPEQYSFKPAQGVT